MNWMMYVEESSVWEGSRRKVPDGAPATTARVIKMQIKAPDIILD